MSSTWYDPLRAIVSLGSKKAKIAHQGQLAASRALHLGQFFTPDVIAAFMWQFVAHLPIKTILDNSIGSARLLQFADPAKHVLYGVDVHAETVKEVMAVAEAAGFQCNILHAGMQDIHPRGIHLALINPPFSVQLNSQNLEVFKGCTTMGRLGPNTSAVSDAYALRQALKAADVVVALMPTTRATEIALSLQRGVQKRLRVVYQLPVNAFGEEGTRVSTSVMIFGEHRDTVDTQFVTVTSFDQLVDDWGLAAAIDPAVVGATLGYSRREQVRPSINLPVTYNNRVSVHLDGRKIKLKFCCGLTQAKVMNKILVRQIASTRENRLPAGVNYAGQGRLDLMAYLIQDDAHAAVMDFLNMIKMAGGNPQPHASFLPTVTRRAREAQRARTPFRRTIWSKQDASAMRFEAVSRKTQAVEPHRWTSPILQKGETVLFEACMGGKYSFVKNGKRFGFDKERIEEMFIREDTIDAWTTINEGKQIFNPQHAILLRKRAHALGINSWLNWDFQLDDLIELLLQPSNTGAVAAWEQACGKSRLSAALILLSGVKHGLIVVESRLISEMLKMLALLPINQGQIHVIDSPRALDSLKTINLISYERLRSSLSQARPSITYAKRLRRRIGLVVPDEAEKLANLDSDQTRALFQLSAKRRVAVTGTPISNLPRDILGLLLFVGGDATPAQPYGYRRGFLDRQWLQTMAHSRRGLDQVCEDFVVLEWATQEWRDTLQKGAKREVPKIKDVEKFRSWLAPLIKRRLVDEPDVKRHIQLPAIHETTTLLDWHPAHLSHYLTVADEFAQWYKEEKKLKGNHNLAILLARIQAVHCGLNIPQADPRYTGGLTSKQTYQIKRLVTIAEEGKKALLFCNNPRMVDLLHLELHQQGIESVKYTGLQTITSRNKAKETLFLNGDVPVLLSTLACGSTGQNVPQADYILFYDRCWSYRTQDQAIKRARRTERKTDIHAEFIHLPGSLDIYQDQLIAFKRDATRSGLDFANPELADTEFIHLVTVLERFVDDVASMHGMESHLMREQLKLAS